MARILITGVSGQDGGILAEQAAVDGHEVHGLVHGGDLEIMRLRERYPGLVLHEGDLTDWSSLQRLMESVEPDEVYNLAGVSSVAQSWAEPLLTADVTGMGVARLMDAVWQHAERAARPVRVLQASSAEIFGEPVKAPQNESTPIRPTSPYGAAKAFAHHIVGVYRERGLHAVSVILYNHESPGRPTTFVTRKITRGVAEIALGRAAELVLGNLDARRDWGWAPDYVDAMRRALSHPDPDDYVVATGRDRSVRDFVAAAFSRVDIDRWEELVRVDPALLRRADPSLLVGDARKARHRLGWAPTVPFDEVVGRMVDADLAELAGARE